MPRSARDEVLRARFEKGIALAAPLLDLVLAIADRTSRIFAGQDPEQITGEGGPPAARLPRRVPARGDDH